VDGTGKLDDSDADRAPDMALPRLNNFSFWILPFAFTLLLSSLFVPGGAPAAAGPCTRHWCCRPGILPDADLLHPPDGASSILGAINVIVTIVNMRAPGLALLRMRCSCGPG